MAVENCVIVTDGSVSEIDFYLHKTNHVLSQLPRPVESDIGQFLQVTLPAKSVEQLLSLHGEPYYIKMDIEHYDQKILSQIQSITVVGSNQPVTHKIVGKISWSHVPGLIYIDVPPAAKDTYMTVLKIALQRPIVLYRGHGGFQ